MGYLKKVLVAGLVIMSLSTSWADYDIDFTSAMGVNWAQPFTEDMIDTSTTSDSQDNDKFIIGSFDLKMKGLGRGSGLDLGFSRYYKSSKTNLTALGYGWISNLDVELEIVSGIYIITDELGITHTFEADGPYHPAFTSTSKPNTNKLYGTGQKWILQPLLWDWETIIFQKKFGTQYHFNRSTLRLEKIVDRNGNEIIYNRDSAGVVTSLQDSSNRQITFTYNATGLVETVTDPLNRVYQYAYDINKNLITVTNPLNDFISYQYADVNDIHNITKVTNPEGDYLDIVYNNDDQVIEYKQNGVNTWTITHNTALKTVNKQNAVGLNITYTFSADGKTTNIVDNFGTQVDVLDDEGFLSQYTDRNGYITTMVRDSLGSVTSMTNARGNNTTTTFSSDYNKPLVMTSPLGLVESFEYDSKGNLTKYTNGEGGEFTLTYNSNGLPLTYTNPLSQNNQYEYDAYGNLIKITKPDGAIFESTFDVIGNKLTNKDANGNIATFEYDLMNRVKKTTYADSSFIESTYDKNGNMLTSKDRKGNITTYQYNNLNLVTSVTNAANLTTQFEYDILGRETKAIKPSGAEYKTEYDVIGRVTKAIAPNNATVEYQYDPQNGSKVSDTTNFIPSKIIDPLGNETTAEYNELYALKKQTDPLGNFYTLEFDALDRIEKFKNALGQETTNTYNQLNQVKTQTNPAGFVTSLTYNNRGQNTQISDREGKVSFLEYDSRGRLNKTINADNKNVTATFDGNGSLLTVTNENGVTVKSCEYDSLNRPTKITHTDGTFKSYQYDLEGNLTQVTREDNSIVTYEYDSINRLTKITYPGNKTVDFEYDINSNITKVTDWIGDTTYIYDSLDRVLSRTDPDGQKITYSYNLNGLITETKIFNSSSVLLYQINYAFDARNLLTSITDNFSNSVVFTYDSLGRVVNKTLGNGVSESFLYDLSGFLTQQKIMTSSQAVLKQWDYTFDKVGNKLTDITLNAVTKTYTYDNLYRLKTYSTSAGDSFQYSYDDVGNRLSFNKNGTVSNFTYNTSNQLTSKTSGSVTTNYTYNQLGQLTNISDGTDTTQLTYNWLNLPATITKAGSVNLSLTNTYNSQRRRVSKAYSSGDSFDYFYDGANTPMVTSSTFTGGSLYRLPGFIDEYFTKTVNSVTEYAIQDTINSERLLLNASQAISSEKDFAPYGSQSLGIQSNYAPGFTGREQDFSDLYFYRNRTYSPIDGVFQQVDPISIAGGLNLYQYVNSSPVNFVDPFGFNAVEKPGPKDPQPPWTVPGAGGDRGPEGPGKPDWDTDGIPTGGNNRSNVELFDGKDNEPNHIEPPGFPGAPGLSMEMVMVMTPNGMMLVPKANLTPPNKYFNKGKNKGKKKGKEFRGGKKKDRDKWFGNKDKGFQKWWEKTKKDYGGVDIESKAQMEALYLDYKAEKGL